MQAKDFGEIHRSGDQMTAGLNGLGAAVPTNASALTPGDIDIDELLAQVERGTPEMGAYPEVGGNRIQLFTNVNDFYDDLRSELVSPDLRTANISEYAWYRNGFGAEATDLVEAALQRGVDVASTTDMMGTRSKFGSFQQRRLARAGAEVAEHRPWMGALADHRKLFVLNGETMYLTGVGLGKKYQQHWEDLAIRIDGPAAAWGQAEHLARLRDMGGDISGVQREVLEQSLRNPVAQGDASVRLMTARPGQPDQIDAYVDAEFARRDRPLFVATSFFADPDRADALVSAAQDGRDVNVVMTPLSWSRQRRQFVPDTVSRTYVDQMVRGGVNVTEPKEFFHAKAVYGGGPDYTVGSANQSGSKYYELNAHVKDPNSAAELGAYFTTQIADGAPMLPEQFANPVDDALRAVVNGFKIRC